MKALRFRQIHLDFHTSGLIPGIGKEFSKEQFQSALKEGHVNSITVFSKCHHGYSYHPSEVNEINPGLDFDLLGAELEACREIDVNAPVYISAGYDEKDAVVHPEWLNKPRPNYGPDFVNDAYYHLMCYNTPYMDKLAAEVDEVMRRYNPIGLFLDISDVRMCYCSHCLESMRQRGLDPHDPADVLKMGEIVYAEYTSRIEKIVRKYNPDTMIFHNAGNIKRGRRDLAYMDTHLELESLPTGGWGYDHFPMSAAYVRTLGMEYMGMTGKFHTTWGEFGGFKHPNALRYETALSIAVGAKCSIGDQLHPNGKMNMSTYRLIGAAYSEVEKKEPWCENVKAVSDIAILSAEAAASSVLTRNNNSDTGASRMLLEGKYLYDLIDEESDFGKYKVLILPDVIEIGEELEARLKAFIDAGGKILASGKSLTRDGKFAIDTGAEFLGTSEFKPSYMVPSEDYPMTNGITEYIMYQDAYKIEPVDGKVVAYRCDPYFNRAPEHFSSHQHTPNDPGSSHPAAVIKNNVAYIGWNVFDDYAERGELATRELVLGILSLLFDGRTLTTNLPDRGVVTLNRQEEKDRLVNHLLFAYTTKRGTNTEIIEDVIPLYNISVSVRTDRKPRRVYLAPQDEDIDFTFANGVVSYTVPKLEIHQMVSIDF